MAGLRSAASDHWKRSGVRSALIEQQLPDGTVGLREKTAKETKSLGEKEH